MAPTASLASVGRERRHGGSAAEAAKFLNEANARRPGDFWIVFELANASRQTKPPAIDEAIRYDTTAVALRPGSVAAHYNLGLGLFDKGRLDEAIMEWRKAVALDPDDVKIRTGLGIALHHKGQLDEAIVEWRKAVALKPDYTEAHSNLGIALRDKGQLDEAIAEWRKVLALNPDDAKAHSNLGNAFVRKHQLDEAIAEFRKAVQIQPAYVNAHYNAACAAALAGCDQSENAAKIDEKERSRWRKQALDWLRTALNLWAKRIDDGKPQDRVAAAKEFKHCQEDSDLAGVRDKDALAKLPADEQDSWRKLWADVDALLKKAQEK
jgi:Flp pilus assembly protein TadD